MIRHLPIWIVGWIGLLVAFPGYAQEPGDALAADTSSSQTRSFFLDGMTVGIGMMAYGYQGALRQNPNDNVLKYLTAAQPSFQVGVDRRMGRYEQYGLDVHLAYTPISGQVSGADAPFTFQSHLVSTEITGMYSLPYIQQDLLRVFAGGGVLWTLVPSFSDNPPGGYNLDAANGQIAGSLVGGLLIHDVFRVGIRLPTSSTLVFASSDRTIHPTPDILGFMQLTYRFAW